MLLIFVCQKEYAINFSDRKLFTAEYKFADKYFFNPKIERRYNYLL